MAAAQIQHIAPSNCKGKSSEIFLLGFVACRVNTYQSLEGLLWDVMLVQPFQWHPMQLHQVHKQHHLKQPYIEHICFDLAEFEWIYRF